MNNILIVGLGNYGSQYINTPHNAGHRSINHFLRILRCSSVKYHGLIDCYDVVICNTHCYMNNSGSFIKKLMTQQMQLCVLHDDLETQVGDIKFKYGGSAGGHNGLRDIDAALRIEYLKIRIGVGRPADKSDVRDFVLQLHSQEEQVIMDNVEKYTAQFLINNIKDIYNHDVESLRKLYRADKSNRNF